MFGRKKVEINDDVPLSRRIELTLLDPRAISTDIHTLINVAMKNKYVGVCVNPTNVADAREYIDEKLRAELLVVSVIGFPLGATPISVKVHEAKQALSDGADELDVVVNIAKIKEGDFGYIKSEMSRMVRISKGRNIKAIIETCYLTRDEIKSVCKALVKAKVDYIKTSTGYGTGGATVEDVSLIKETVGNKCLIKASGGIRTIAQAEELVRAGASRIGTSRVI